MNTSTSPVALVAPSIRALMAPSLLLLLSNFTPSSVATYSLRADLSCPGIDGVVVRGVTGATATERAMSITSVSNSLPGAVLSTRGQRIPYVPTGRLLLRCQLFHWFHQWVRLLSRAKQEEWYRITRTG